MPDADRSVVVAWSGLPVYGATCIRAAFDRFGESFPVLATRATVPITGVAERLGSEPIVLEGTRAYRWADLGLEPPRFFVKSGWGRTAFDSLGREVKAAGGRVAAMADTQWLGTPRQWLGCLAFRLKLRREIDFLWMSGEAGRVAARWFGMPEHRVQIGFCPAAPDLFRPGDPLAERPPRMVFVGRYAEEKGIADLAGAMRSLMRTHPEWRLVAYGEGPLGGLLEGLPNVEAHAFVPAERVARAMREARFLVLPSRFEPWGVVVHEAALSGCGLILSDRVGARVDFLEPGINGFQHRAGDAVSLTRAVARAAELGGGALERAQATSLERAAGFSPERWARTLEVMMTATT